jgi:hypothetical protein
VVISKVDSCIGKRRFITLPWVILWLYFLRRS